MMFVLENAGNLQSAVDVAALDLEFDPYLEGMRQVFKDEGGIVEILLRFQARMAVEGEAVQLSRFCRDRLYAYERIVTAQESSDPELRRLALDLFNTRHPLRRSRST